MRNFFILFMLIGLSACNSGKNKKVNTNGSDIQIIDGETILNNLYYQNLGNGKVLAINEIENINDSLKLSKHIIFPVLPKTDSAKWQINFTAQNFEINKNYLISESYVDGKDYTYELFNLTSGKKIMDYTYDKFEALYTNENEKRIVGFYTKNAVNREKSELKFDDKTLGYFIYASAKGVINKIKVEVKDESLKDKYDVSNTSIELNSTAETGVLRFNSNKSIFFTSLSGEDKSKINFDVEVTFFSFTPYEPHPIKLTVENNLLKFNEADLRGTDFNLVLN